MTGRNWVAAAALVALIAPRIAAADYWSYETENGGIAFTDDPKAIPTKYQKDAKAVKEQSIYGYDRLSVVQTPVAAPTPAGVAARDAAVPVFPWPVQQPVAPAPQPSRVTLNVGGMQIAVDGNGDEDEEPLIVDRRQYTDADGDYFDHGGIMSPTTVIRRGDKTLAYIDERE
jgi:hypothetical protein